MTDTHAAQPATDQPSPTVLPFRPVLTLQTALFRGTMIGLGTGALIGLFRLTHDRAAETIQNLFQTRSLLEGNTVLLVILWFGVLVVLAFVIRKLVRFEPLISGSGIPQTELTLAGKLPLPWLRVLLCKYVGSWLALVAGLSLGREGPSIQMGGAAGRSVEHFWTHTTPLPTVAHNPHIIAGAVAGLAAAFGAPLAGVVFAFEEMKCRLSLSLLIFTCAAAGGAHLMLHDLLDLGRILPFPEVTPPEPEAYWQLVLFGMLLGWLGTLYNRALLWLWEAEERQTLLPDAWRMLPILLCAGIATLFFPQILGGGEKLILILGSPEGSTFTLNALLLLLLLKFLFSIYSVTAGVPGGLLMPILCLGALWGSLWVAVALPLLDGMTATLITGTWPGWETPDSGQLAAYVLFSMSGYFAATVRAPLTGVLLVTEMSGAVHCLPGNLLIALLACFTANRLHCPPVYSSLKAQIEDEPAFKT